jgi:acyl-CoA dehydrogenase
VRLPFTQLDKVAAKGLELGVITEQEADLLRRTEAGRLRTINVDDFDPAELIANTAAQ